MIYVLKPSFYSGTVINTMKVPTLPMVNSAQVEEYICFSALFSRHYGVMCQIMRPG